MRKAKFQIKGIHSQSCASLIENKLKDLAGVINAKVNFDSQKAVVVWNEGKIEKRDIFQTVREAGDYSVEERKEEKAEERTKGNNQSLSRNPFLLGFLAGFSFLSLGFNIFFAVKFLSQTTWQSSKTVPTDQPQVLPAQQAPNQGENPLTTQTFEVTKNDHILGDFNAPITLVEFSDFECPFCERHYPTLNKILSDYKGKVRLVYKHFPLGFHPNAQKAAEASECASEQGKFWEYHDKLFNNLQVGYSLENFKKWAKDLGLNSGKFNDCLDSGKYAQKVQKDSQEGSQKGVNGTPATFVNGQLVSGALPYESFKQIVDLLLK